MGSFSFSKSLPESAALSRIAERNEARLRIIFTIYGDLRLLCLGSQFLPPVADLANNSGGPECARQLGMGPLCFKYPTAARQTYLFKGLADW